MKPNDSSSCKQKLVIGPISNQIYPVHTFKSVFFKMYILILFSPSIRKGACCWCRSWLRHCTTNRKVASSIPDGVIGIFHWHNPSGRTMALGLTQPLTEMSTRNISWGVKATGGSGWQPYHLHVPIVLKSGRLNLLEPYGPVQACNEISLPLPLPSIRNYSNIPLSSEFLLTKCYINLWHLHCVLRGHNISPSYI
jgi:hypothetical protein